MEGRLGEGDGRVAWSGSEHLVIRARHREAPEGRACRWPLTELLCLRVTHTLCAVAPPAAVAIIYSLFYTTTHVHSLCQRESPYALAGGYYDWADAELFELGRVLAAKSYSSASSGRPRHSSASK